MIFSLKEDCRNEGLFRQLRVTFLWGDVMLKTIFYFQVILFNSNARKKAANLAENQIPVDFRYIFTCKNYLPTNIFTYLLNFQNGLKEGLAGN
jgi:hypothetical protein